MRRSAATSACSATRWTATLLWKHTWAPQPIYLDFGTASSPVVHDGRVYQLHDNDGESFLAALDAKTGKELWNVKRTDSAARLASGWATPFIWEARRAHRDRHDRPRLRDQLRHRRTRAVAAEGHDAGDAEPGRGATACCTSDPGSQGEANRPLLAIRPGASGDISLRQGPDVNEFVAWSQPRFSGYTPSPLVYRGRVYAVNDNGILQVADAKTGAEIYKARSGRRRPHVLELAAREPGTHLLLSEDGDAFVLRAGDKYDEICEEQPRRDEPCDAGRRRRQPLRPDADEALSDQ